MNAVRHLGARLLVLGLAGCGGLEPAAEAVAEPAPAPIADFTLSAGQRDPVGLFGAVCLEQMPDFAGTGAALDAAGLANARDPDGTLVGQGPGVGVLVVDTVTAEGAPAIGCLVGADGTAASLKAPVRAAITARADDVDERPVAEEGLTGTRWSWAEAGRTVTAELFDDPKNGEVKLLLTVPRNAG